MKLWIALATLVVFAAGVAVGGATFRVSSSSARHSPPDGPWREWPPFGRTPFNKEFCVQELDLSESQQKRFDEILDRYESSVKEVFSLRREVREAIGLLLTTSQKVKLAELQKEKALQELRLRVDGELADLKKKLDLSDDQVAKMRPILLEYGEARQNPTDQGKQEIDGLRERRNAKIRDALSAEKCAKYIDYKESQWGGRRRPGPKQEKKAPAP